MKSATRSLAEFVEAASVESLPRHLYGLAKLYTLDTIGVALFGSTKPWSGILAGHARRFHVGGGNCTVLGEEWTAAPTIAALVNGTMGHAFELDDVHDESLLHPGTVVVPAALAVSEEVGATGPDFLTAVIVGYELMVRAGLGVGSLAHMMGGFHSTGTNGVFGAAAATAKLLPSRGKTDHVVNAFGIAGSLASGIMEFSQSGGMVKRLHAGRAAEGGVLAAYLALDGFTGPATVLEGKYGYCAAFSTAPEPDRLLTDLGKKFAIEEITVKPYACCSDLHAIIDCVRAIRDDKDLDVRQIRRVTVRTYSKVIEQNALDGTVSIMAAQYSALFAAAASLLYDISDPRVYSDATLADPRLGALCRKVDLKLDERLEAEYPRSLGAEVAVEFTDGSRVSKRVVGARGSPFNPLSPAEVERKFRQLTAGLLSGEAIAETIACVNELDNAASLSQLTGLLRTHVIAGTTARSRPSHAFG